MTNMKYLLLILLASCKGAYNRVTYKIDDAQAIDLTEDRVNLIYFDSSRLEYQFTTYQIDRYNCNKTRCKFNLENGAKMKVTDHNYIELFSKGNRVADYNVEITTKILGL